MEKIRPRRSVLFMPGSNARALEKAHGLDCDVAALDLEDAVAPEAKVAARAAVCAAIPGFAEKEIFVRINALSTPWGEEDLKAVARAEPDAVILPKVETAADIGEVREFEDGLNVWAMIETPAAVLNAAAIAREADGLILGSNDLLKAIGARTMGSRENLWTAMSLVVLAARAAGIPVIDDTYNDMTDAAGLDRACEQGRSFGFDGKTLIHPSQIDAANRAFAPSETEIAAARAIQAAFAANPDKSVIALDGRMVERLHAEEAARILALAEAIQKQ
jgi:citrate lyase subunit beta/citryl-CoA lyase